MVARRGLNFRAPGSIAAGVGEVLVTGQYNSSQRLSDLGEKGVYSSYTPVARVLFTLRRVLTGGRKSRLLSIPFCLQC